MPSTNNHNGCNHIFLEWPTKNISTVAIMLFLSSSPSKAKDCLFCPIDPSYLIQSHLFGNLVALMRAEKFVDSHFAHVGVAKSALFAVDARVGEAELVAALRPLKVHHHLKAT